jgi:hypothetical protein
MTFICNSKKKSGVIEKYSKINLELAKIAKFHYIKIGKTKFNISPLEGI